MDAWEPLSKTGLLAYIEMAEQKMKAGELSLWQFIKIEPSKWREDEYGNEGGGFWAVAVFGNHVLWYNDVEEGFNVSVYSVYGVIDEYACEQNELSSVIYRMLENIRGFQNLVVE